MTLEQIQALSDDEIRVMVAKLAGWHPIEDVYGYPPDPDYVWGYKGPGMLELPNYPADLNACRFDFETGTRMDRNQRNRYLNTLYNLTWSEDNDEVDDDFAWLTASARARCEAFLAVMQP